jgi:hypothetical protein
MLVMVATVTRTMAVQSRIRSAKSTVETERVRTVSVSNARRSNRAYVAVTIKLFGLNFVAFFYGYNTRNEKHTESLSCAKRAVDQGASWLDARSCCVSFP